MEAYMYSVKNERGSVLIFATLIIVLLLIMVGMGLDTGHLAYVRSQGQPAVDAAALAAASAIPTGNLTTVTDQAAKLNPGGGNPGAGNNYMDSSKNKIAANNVTLVKYDNVTRTVTTSGITIANANGVREALENNNPYGGTAGAAMKSPLFLTPLFNLFGETTSTTADVSVSSVAVIRALPGLPIVVKTTICGTSATLNFQGGPGNNAGWETYYIENASATEIRDLWDALPQCAGQPVVDIGFCGNMNNGVIDNIFKKNIKDIYDADMKTFGKACYLIPAVDPNTFNNFNQCAPIKDWAELCL